MSIPRGFHGPDLACDYCLSTAMGGSCSGGCGEMRCVCQIGKPCETCRSQQEYDDDQARFEAEREERAQFEDRMYEKYHRD